MSAMLRLNRFDEAVKAAQDRRGWSTEGSRGMQAENMQICLFACFSFGFLKLVFEGFWLSFQALGSIEK